MSNGKRILTLLLNKSILNTSCVEDTQTKMKQIFFQPLFAVPLNALTVSHFHSKRLAYKHSMQFFGSIHIILLDISKEPTLVFIESVEEVDTSGPIRILAWMARKKLTKPTSR